GCVSSSGAVRCHLPFTSSGFCSSSRCSSGCSPCPYARPNAAAGTTPKRHPAALTRCLWEAGTFSCRKTYGAYEPCLLQPYGDRISTGSILALSAAGCVGGEDRK